MNVNVVKEGSALREAFKEFGIDYKVGMTVAEEYVDKVFALKQTYGLYTYDTDAHYACIKKWIKNERTAPKRVMPFSDFITKLAEIKAGRDCFTKWDLALEPDVSVVVQVGNSMAVLPSAINMTCVPFFNKDVGDISFNSVINIDVYRELPEQSQILVHFGNWYCKCMRTSDNTYEGVRQLRVSPGFYVYMKFKVNGGV